MSNRDPQPPRLPGEDLADYWKRTGNFPPRGPRIPTPDAPSKQGKAHAMVLLRGGHRAQREPSDPLLGKPLLGDTLPVGVLAATDLATAELVKQEHGDDLLYCASLGWLTWDGRRFVRQEDAAEVSRCVQNVARRLEAGAAELMAQCARADGDDRKALRARADELVAWARKAQRAVGITAAIDLLKTLVPVKAEDLDTNPRLLNVENGTLELVDVDEVPEGQDWNRDAKVVLREHRRGDRITRLCSVRYDPTATAPRFEAFIARILPDQYVREFVQRWFGYCLTGSVEEQCFAIAHGSGANGKSVLLDTMRKLLGDYGLATPTETLMAADHGRGIANDIARLRGARFVVSQETTEGRRLDEARVKQLTGGDMIVARFLHREFFEFEPTHKLMLGCNHRPEIRGTDHGIWRRIHLVPFEVTIPEDERDLSLPAKLLEELPGILTWLAEGFVWWRRIGLAPPHAVRAATDSWRGESDDVGRFVAECCETGGRYAKVKTGALYERFVKWSQSQGNREPLKSSAFGKRILGLPGISKERGTAGQGFYIGIEVRQEQDSRYLS